MALRREKYMVFPLFVTGVGTSRYDDQGMLVDAAVAGVATLRYDDRPY